MTDSMVAHALQVRIFIQGDDAKAKNWTAFFSVPVKHFRTIRDMIGVLRESRRGDVLIFRYQNNPRRLLAALAVGLVLFSQLVKARLAGMRVVWICHNVDQETQPYFKPIERWRRRLLARFADAVYVLDPLFVQYCVRSDAKAITFGPKEGGKVSSANLSAIENLADRTDDIILIAGQDGGKYMGFARIPEIEARFCTLGRSAGFVVAGMSPDRRFTDEIESRLLRIVESNIDERKLSQLVSYIYRENADISVPYTIYAAASASIPVLTKEETLLEEIVERERIGTSLASLNINEQEQNFDFVGFLERHSWISLHDALIRDGILE